MVWALGYRRDTILLVHGDTYHRVFPTEPNELCQFQGLSRDEERELMTYLESKRTGARADISYHRDTHDDHDRICAELELDEARTKVGLFTNVA